MPNRHNMRKFQFAVLFIVSACLTIIGANNAPVKIFTPSNTIFINSITGYEKDKDGLWIETPYHGLEEYSLNENSKILGKNNTLKSIYILDPHDIIQISLSKDSYSQFKKDKSIQNLKEEEWFDVFNTQSKKLKDRHDKINAERVQFLADSMAEVNRREEIRRNEEARRNDSINAVKRAVEQAESDSIYRSTHNYSRVYLPKTLDKIGSTPRRINCIMEDCGYEYNTDNLYIWSQRGDTIVTIDHKPAELGINMVEAHAFVMTEDLKNEPTLSQHLRAFKDEFNKDDQSVEDQVLMIKYLGFKNALEELRKEAPNGFIDDWGWNDEYGLVSLNLRYMNTNKKTIKYIKVYFSIYNAVDDVRCSGSLTGTGPVEELSFGEWDFDNTGYWVSGDATTMKITKIHITYMNGSTATLTGNKIIYN